MIGISRLFIVMLTLTSTFLQADPVDRAETALKQYRAGEAATDLDQRERAFNEALVIYGELAEEYPSSRVYYNLGNCYFQLGEYAWATLYYHRALKGLPNDDRIRQNLAVAQEKLDIQDSMAPSPFETIFYFHYRLSFAQRWAWFSIYATAATLLFAGFVWQKRRFWKIGGIWCSLAAMMFLSSIGASYFFGSVYGVVVRSAPLYRDAGARYALVRQAPLPAGVRVEVVDVVEEGAWLRVTGDKTMGFVEADHVRMI